MPNGRETNLQINTFYVDWDSKTRSKEQDAVKLFLRLHCKNHIILEEVSLPGMRLFVDFLDLTAKIAIEHQSSAKNGHHLKYSEFFHKNKTGYVKSLKRDMDKRENLEKNGFMLVETFTEDLPLSAQWFWENYKIKI